MVTDDLKREAERLDQEAQKQSAPDGDEPLSGEHQAAVDIDLEEKAIEGCRDALSMLSGFVSMFTGVEADPDFMDEGARRWGRYIAKEKPHWIPYLEKTRLGSAIEWTADYSYTSYQQIGARVEAIKQKQAAADQIIPEDEPVKEGGHAVNNL